MKKDNQALETLLWSIALPGFGQFINGKYIKGILLVIIEILINVQARLNVAIVFSFYGQMNEAVQQSNYQWLMFYPCIYLFGIWDAYRDAGGYTKPYDFLPFLMSAYVGTIGVIYSHTFEIFGVMLGPIFLPILSLILGAFIGYLIQSRLIKKNPSEPETSGNTEGS
ncbi:hypothetical protein [Caldalkalibacillus salinus]|uniref:hypothetical protein n=1 Tax=Caldalkalibacillus salinus TaxID=2803787 RepID=UPI0019239578|nr:hypothetical protein [Caldalkalibacillus salinus]